jgi:hypothetical protein
MFILIAKLKFNVEMTPINLCSDFSKLLSLAFIIIMGIMGGGNNSLEDLMILRNCKIVFKKICKIYFCCFTHTYILDWMLFSQDRGKTN